MALDITTEPDFTAGLAMPIALIFAAARDIFKNASITRFSPSFYSILECGFVLECVEKIIFYRRLASWRFESERDSFCK